MSTTAAEQYMLELVNRTRLDPQGELSRLSDEWASATLAHSQLVMVDHRRCLHILLTPSQVISGLIVRPKSTSTGCCKWIVSATLASAVQTPVRG